MKHPDYMKARIKTFKDFVGELSVNYKRTSQPIIKINNSNEVYEWLYPYFDEIMDDHEVAKVIHLNRANQIVNLHHVSSGSDSGTIIPIKDILRQVVLIKTSSIILAHNHPSSNIKPSRADIQITQKLKEACKLFEIQLIDSIILTRENYYSLADNAQL